LLVFFFASFRVFFCLSVFFRLCVLFFFFLLFVLEDSAFFFVVLFSDLGFRFSLYPPLVACFFFFFFFCWRVSGILRNIPFFYNDGLPPRNPFLFWFCFCHRPGFVVILFRQRPTYLVHNLAAEPYSLTASIFFRAPFGSSAVVGFSAAGCFF